MKLPQIPDAVRSRIQFDISDRTMARWNPAVHAAAEDDNSISVFDVIGEDWWTGEGVTAKRISAALRKIGAGNPVTVNVNSPGGDLFEGLAIYNLLREHKGEVTVKVLGLAASAASIIAMAGSRVEIARAGFLMVHNTWIVAMGNRHDMAEFAERLAPFDEAMADVYAARTGRPISEMQELMDAESWISGKAAIDSGFADGYLPADAVEEDAQARADRVAAHQIELAMAKAGLPRSERRRLMQEFKSSMQTAAGTGTPGAAGDTRDAVEIEANPMPRIEFPYSMEITQ
jgi:ATP-dependent Clp protease, protease subunit